VPLTDRTSSPDRATELTQTRELSCATTVEFALPHTFQFESKAEATVHALVWAEVNKSTLSTPTRRWRNWLILLGTLGLFLAAGLAVLAPIALMVLVVVLTVHEFGHFLAMKAFGYRDVKIFFIPFLGAGVSGSKHAAPAWQRIVVILLGPLPGLVVGALIYLVLREPFYDGLGLLVLGLVLINGMNLIPVEPFDGGKLIHLVIYSRNPSMELFFLVLAGAFLGGIGILGGHWALVLVAAVLLIGAWPRHNRAVRASEVRRLRPQMPFHLDRLSAVDRLVLVRQAIRMSGGAGTSQGKPWPNPTATARVVRTLHDAVVTRPPTIRASIMAIGIWLFGVAVTLSVILLWSHDRETATREQTQPGMTERLAAPPPGGWEKTTPNTP